MGLSALSRRLVKDELARGTLRPLTLVGWPLRRKIRLIQLKDAFVLKAVEHFINLARAQNP